MDGFLVIAFGLLGLLLPLSFIQLWFYVNDKKKK
jgi:hypothetical protein